MQLRGIDIEETKHMDTHFYFVNSTHIIGKTRSSIVFQNNEWHIKTGMKSVYTTSGKMVPLGIQDKNGMELWEPSICFFTRRLSNRYV